MPEGIPAPGVNISMPYSWENLQSIVPADVKIVPNFMIPQQPYARQTTIGRLLTPQEGCGTSSVGVNRIVGGVSARNGR